MNAVPTDDLRVVKEKLPGVERVFEGTIYSAAIPVFAVVAVQRRWLVPDGEAYRNEPTNIPRNFEDININPQFSAACDTFRVPVRQPVRSEWRDLPEVEL